MSNNESTTTISYTIDKKALVSGAVTLIGALAWNEVAKKFINYVYPVDSTNSQKHILLATLIYAIFVTITLLCIVEIYNVASCTIRRHKVKNAMISRMRNDETARTRSLFESHNKIGSQ